jgi:hypothetical protein
MSVPSPAVLGHLGRGYAELRLYGVLGSHTHAATTQRYNQCCPTVSLAFVTSAILIFGPGSGLDYWLALGFGLGLALRSREWFVLLQQFAHRRLARVGNLPPRPSAFLEWGIEAQIFRRVGGGVRFGHGLIQQHLTDTSEGVP